MVGVDDADRTFGAPLGGPHCGALKLLGNQLDLHFGVTVVVPKIEQVRCSSEAERVPLAEIRINHDSHAQPPYRIASSGSVSDPDDRSAIDLNLEKYGTTNVGWRVSFRRAEPVLDPGTAHTVT